MSTTQVSNSKENSGFCNQFDPALAVLSDAFVGQPADSDAASMIRFKTFLNPDPPFYFGNRITAELGPLLKQRNPDRVYLVTNNFLFEQYGEELLQTLDRSSIHHDVVIIEDGEDHKNFSTLERLCETLVDRNISKSSIILGFGGGCLTNIAGLAAGLIFRGIRYVEMPTTLMGITDSTLSNKQAVNGNQGKNHFGMYYAPIFIFGDTRYLATESSNGRRAAVAEGIKNGFISNPELLDFFESMLSDGIERWTESDLTQLAQRIIASKLRILERDPSEKGYAITLEYGHTFGHAMEFLAKGRLPHGFAVAKGMCIAAEISCILGSISRDVVDRHYRLFGELLGVDLAIPEYLQTKDIFRAMLTDNKKVAAGTKFVLLRQIGECLNPDGDFQVYVEPEVAAAALSRYRGKTQHAA